MEFFNKKNIVISICLILFIILSAGTATYLMISNNTYGSGFDNTVYSSGFYKNKKVLIVSPHEDDEINFAGATIKNYTNVGSEVHIVFTTNGDYYNKSETRIKEAIDAAKVLGVDENQVHFLGYGDQWKSKYGHIYNAPDNEVITSHIGKTSTYGSDLKKDYRSIKDGAPSSYTRNNLKKDMIDCILDLKPDVIYCVDFDFHVDHRAASLMFEESMGYILQNTTDYHPEIYKGYSYNTAWNSIQDFYEYNLQSTLKPQKTSIQNSDYELDTPSYNWRDRVRLLVPKETLTYTLKANPIYHALAAYPSQDAKLQAEQVINSDQVFFNRDTNSVTYHSKIEGSSGNTDYLNDFKVIDSSNICQKYNVNFDHATWTPRIEDNQKSVKINFDQPYDINKVTLYDNPSLKDNILSGKLFFSDGSMICVDELLSNGSKTEISFTTKKNISFVEFKIDTYEGEKAGLNEIEVHQDKYNESDHFIKLIKDDLSEMFLYRYYVTDEHEIPIKVYEFPSNQKKNIEDFEITSDSKLQIHDGKILIPENIDPGIYKIRINIKNHKEIYDEIEIVIPNFFEKSKVKYIDNLERLFNHLFD